MRALENKIFRGQLLHIALQERYHHGVSDCNNFISPQALSRPSCVQADHERAGYQREVLAAQLEQFACTEHAVGDNPATHVVGSQAYVEGLVWRDIGSHPQAAKQPGWGTWAWAPLGAAGSQPLAEKEDSQ